MVGSRTGAPTLGSGGCSTAFAVASVRLPGSSDSLSSSVHFPGVPGYAAYLAPFISDRDEEGLSSCSARPCHHAVDNHPAGVFQRISHFALAHVAFTVAIAGSASRAESFEATSRSLALRPGDSPSPFR
jgi:hypothetical protein